MKRGRSIAAPRSRSRDPIASRHRARGPHSFLRVTPESTFAALPAICPACGSELAPSLLACPACGRLLHGDQLKSLAARAEQSARDGDNSAEIALWREAMGLLPGNSRQYATISARVAELS